MIDNCYNIEYLDYGLNLHFFPYNIWADIFFGLLQMFQVELELILELIFFFSK